MNIAELSIKKSVITWVMTILMVVVGAMSFFNLSWLEDPEFSIKEAVVLTPYPGASAAEVEEEVTNVLEMACQELGQLDYVESRSSRGFSQLKVVMKNKYNKTALPQIWDELRRKINDYQLKLPPGAGPSIVNDDFGDVYGVYIALTGEGYSNNEMYEFAKFLQRELLQVKGVKRVVLYGNQPEVIFIEMRREKMAELGISPQDIYGSLAAKNLPVTSGNLTLGKEYIPVNPTGEFKSEEDFGNLLVSSRGKTSDRLIYLRDVASIKRGYKDPPKNILRFDGKTAIGLGISTVEGGNVVTMGKALEKRLNEIKPQAPLGMDGHIIALQSETVTQSIKGFLVNLAAAVIIVVLILLIFMGFRSGMIIGAILFITIMGTFIFMDIYDVTLERISLGALVIALGMLVDNAIVVTDGIRMKMKQGVDAVVAAKEIVGQTAIPLLGATIIAVTAFASIGTSKDSTGEYCSSLFSVILISLMLSWVTAVTVTPLFCKLFLKGKDKGNDKDEKDPYEGKFYKLYSSFLSSSIRHRWVTIGIVVGLFVLSIIGFGYVKTSFFPDSTRPQFYVDFWFPEGTHIDETARQMERAEQELLSMDEVSHISTHIGGGQVRFLLTYSPESTYPGFAQIIADVKDYKAIPKLAKTIQSDLEQKFPQAIINVRQFVLGPSVGGKIQLRLYGPDPEVLRVLSEKAKNILLDDPISRAVRDEWRTKVKVIRPQLAEAQARRAGIGRPDLAQAIEAAVEGTTVGVYRERDELLPIIARSPAAERVDLDNLEGIQIWSPVAQQMIPAGQVVTDFKLEFEDAYLWRRNRTKMLKIHADPRKGLPSELFARIKPQVEKALNVDVARITGKRFGPEQDPFAEYDATTLKVGENDNWPIKGMPGYSMAWGGEAEDSARAQGSLGKTVPVFFGLMILIVIWLFNSIKKTLIIWLTVPLALIGVAAGLLMFHQPFGFMALLGLMSLSGMLIKNAIVLIDQIDTEIVSGKNHFQAIVDSGVSRLIPVSMAALTTILGMLPLLTDAFFIAMAVTIMFGLGFATVLTLIVVPVFYAIFFKVPNEA